MSESVRWVAACLAIGLACQARLALGQTSIESSSLADPNLLAAIFVTPPATSVSASDETGTTEIAPWEKSRHGFRFPAYHPPIPVDWEAFDKRFSPDPQPGRPTLRLLENGMYEVNETLYSIKLVERKVNSLLSFEYSLRALGGYDPRSRANAIDSVFDHATVKTDFNWDAPIGLYAGVRFTLRCNSIFEFWK